MSRANASPSTRLADLSIPARAIVCVGGVDTEYVRTGAGNPVVLLGGGADDAWPGPIGERLARDFLVIASRTPTGVVLISWLRDFLDGLGVSRVALVVVGALASAALTFAEADDTPVARVVVLIRGYGDCALLTHVLRCGDSVALARGQNWL